MELIVLAVLAFVGTVVVGSFLGIAAFVKTQRIEEMALQCGGDEVALLRRDLEALEARVGLLARDGLRVEVPVEAVVTVPAEAVSAPIAPPLDHAPPLGPDGRLPPPTGRSDLDAPTEPREADAAPASAHAADDEDAQIWPAPDWWRGLEETVGKHWITWAGAIALFAGAAFFVKFAVDQGWLGPLPRVLLAVGFGTTLVVAGERFVRREMRPLGLGLLGSGLAILYVALYGAHGLYGLIPYLVAFGLMALVTAAGMAIAVLRDARPVSFLALVGGLATPLILWSEGVPRDVLFGYLLILDVGVLGVALFKQWRALDVGASIGTWVLFGLWVATDTTSVHWEPAALWLGAFHFVLLAIPFAFHLRRKTIVARERIFMAVTHGFVVFGFAVTIFADANVLLGEATLGLAASFAALAILARRRIPVDSSARLSLTVLWITFLTLALPILLDFQAVTIAFAVEAVALLALGYTYRYLPERTLSLAPLGLAMGRVLLVDWPLHQGPTIVGVSSELGTALVVALACGVYFLIHERHRLHARDWERVLSGTAALAGAALALAAVHSELWSWLDLAHRGDHARWACAAVWTVGAGALLFAGFARRWLPARVAGLVALGVAIVLVGWDYGGGFAPLSLFVLNGRFVVAAAAWALLALTGRAYRNDRASDYPSEQALGTPMIGAAIGLAALLLNVEVSSWLRAHDHPELILQVSPFIWAAAWGAGLWGGLRLGESQLRWVGLGALCIAAATAALSYLGAYGELPFASLRFVGGLMTLVALFGHAAVLRHRRDDVTLAEGQAISFLEGAGILSAAALTSAELAQWILPTARPGLLSSLLALTWTVTAAAFLASSRRLALPSYRKAGLFSLALGGLAAASAFVSGADGEGWLLFANLRFVVALTVVLMAFTFAWSFGRRDEELGDEDEDKVLKRFLAATATGSLLLLLSLETWVFFTDSIVEAARARQLSQMSLSIVWATFAVGSLLVGFWRRVRALRLAGLALFGATAAKLIVVDTASMEGLYRIASFLAVGLLMIGASYTYHRAERRLFSSE